MSALIQYLDFGVCGGRSHCRLGRRRGLLPHNVRFWCETLGARGDVLCVEPALVFGRADKLEAVSHLRCRNSGLGGLAAKNLWYLA